MTPWKKIWNKEERVGRIIMECLIKANGYDGNGASEFDVDGWLEYVNGINKKIVILEQDSVFEIGCGSSAFLYPLYLKGHAVGGVDYSNILIKLASGLMPNGDFTYSDAIELNVSKKYDVVLSNSVFHYFKNIDYAGKVIKKMIEKANKSIAILDIPDQSKEGLCIKTRKENYDKYEEKYKNLDHLFYEKKWFIRMANKYGLKIRFFDQEKSSNINSAFRFNVIMEK